MNERVAAIWRGAATEEGPASERSRPQQSADPTQAVRRSRQPDARWVGARLESHRASDAAPRRAECAACSHRRRRLREPEHLRRTDPNAELHPRRRARLRYNRFHVTALCSPTRASLLTGRNNHTVGFGSIGEFAGGFPGYSATLPRNSAPLPRILRDNGYSTAAFGKWHLTPDGQQGPAGPFDRWPNGWGFDYFYGFLGGGASQWDPCLAENQKIIGTPEEFYDEENPYYFPHDGRPHDRMAARRPRPDAHKPFFVYFSTGCSHSPHHVGQSWADKYKGQFDQGWDKLREETFARQKQLGVVPADAELTPRDEAFPAWDGLSDKLKTFYARQMEVYAGILGERRLQRGPRHRSDRGARRARQHGHPLDLGRQRRQHGGNHHRLVQRAHDAERHSAHRRDAAPAVGALRRPRSSGAPRSWIPHYGAAWAWAGNTPFQWGKQVGSHLGGTRNPLVVQWPERIHDGGGLRSQFTHVIDVAPMILDIAGIPAPHTVDGIEQQPMHGSTFAASFTDTGAPEHRTQQYFETIGNHAMYKDGWWLAMKTDRVPWVRYAGGIEAVRAWCLGSRFRSGRALLPSRRLLAGQRRLGRQSREGRGAQGTVLGGGGAVPGAAVARDTLDLLWPSCHRSPDETKFEFRGDVQNVLSGMIRGSTTVPTPITADLVVPEGGVEGVIVAEADHLGGFTLYVKDGKLTHTYSMMGVFIFKQEADEELPTGDVTVRMEFAADAATPATGGEVTLFIDDRPVGKGHMDHTVPIRFSGYAGMDIGRDNGGVVDHAYEHFEAVRIHGDGQEGHLRHQAAPLRPGRASTCMPRSSTVTRPTRSRHDLRSPGREVDVI